ncbi:hypothetical protein FP744_10005072 [Trichoderma asperellum]
MARRVIAPGHSCLECRRRKIKCDRSLPCSYCARIKLQCSYPSWRPNRSNHGESDLAAKVQSLECTLQSLEQKITRIGNLLNANPELPIRQDHAEREHQFSIEDAHDLPSPSWSSPRINSQSNSSQYNTGTRSPNSHLLQSLPFNSLAGISQPLEALHPPPSSISFIWQTYLDVVDPLLKIFHVPSIQRHVMSISQGREIPDAATECLMFAIYYSTVISIPVAECRDEFGEEKPLLLQRHVDVVLLYLLLFLPEYSIIDRFQICGRLDENGPDVCSLIGLAIGNAMKLGLHIDIPGMCTFEVEMRRRLWWQICTLDVRVAEDFGGEPYIIEPNLRTELPLNVNDISLDPHIGELNPQPGRSEMLFSLVRFEVSHFARRIVFSDRFCRINNYEIMNEAQKCQAVDQFKERIEKQYLSYCHKAIPLDCVTVMSNRLILAKLKLAVYKPRADQNHGMPLRANYRRACEEFLEHAHELRQYSKGRRWLWLFQTYVEWDALAYLLLDICITLSSPGLSPNESINAPWKVVKESYNHWKNNPDVHRDRRWMNIEELHSHALSIRERAQNATQVSQTTPSYCSQQAHDQSDGVSDDAIEMQQQYESSPDSMYTRNTATNAENRIIPVSLNSMNKNTQIQRSYATDLQGPESNMLPDQVPLMWALANAAAASAEEAQISVTTADMPGAGTACEWSASLIETYWEVAGQGNDGSSAWPPR